MNKRLIYILFVLIARTTCATGPYSSLNMFTFLHTDKYCYVAGDYILLNGYHLSNKIGNKLSETALYIDLINSNKLLVKGDILEINEGIASGVMQIPDSLRSGEYTIRAYTNHSKKFEGQEILYSQRIYVTNRFGNNGPLTRPELKMLSIPTDSILNILKKKNEYVSIDFDQKKAKRRTKVKGVLSVSGTSDLYSSISVKPASPYEVYYDTTNSIAYTVNNNGRNNYESTEYTEAKGILCSGRVTNKETFEPIPNAIVIISACDSSLRFRAGYTNEKGDFNILLKSFFNKKEFYITCFTYPDLRFNSKARVKLHSKFLGGKESGNIESHNSLYERSLDTTNVRKALINRAYKISNVEKISVADSVTESYENKYLMGNNSFTVLLDNYIELINFEEITREILPFAKMRIKDGRYSISVVDAELKIIRDNAFVFVDGVPLAQIDKLAKVKGKNIKQVNVVGESRYYGNIGFRNGLMMVWTRDLSFWDNREEEYTKTFEVEGLQSKVIINFPDYGEDKELIFPDFRQTLYWNPELKLQSENKASFEFYTSDETGWFEVCLQGVTGSGKPVFVRDFIYVE